jgi:ATP-dependent Lon protease
MPWGKTTEDNLDLANARAILDEDHFDLREVKDRIIEHLAVMKLNSDAKAPILCFVGPPGVGKTSLGQSIARALGRITRKVATRVAEGNAQPVTLTRDRVTEYLGPPRLAQELRRQSLPRGVVPGLAWTEAGGEVLYVEAVLLPEGRDLLLTGQLGSVMQESAKAAQSYIWSQAEALGIDKERIRKSGVHIHVPAGATPKDGPSAGVTMATALASAYTATPVRSDTAMTGEITLSGLVLPVGGIKEKMLAAHRAGFDRVILPKENEPDLAELPEQVRKELELVFAERIEEVFAAAIPGFSEAR